MRSTSNYELKVKIRQVKRMIYHQAITLFNVYILPSHIRQVTKKILITGSASLCAVWSKGLRIILTKWVHVVPIYLRENISAANISKTRTRKWKLNDPFWIIVWTNY